MTEHLLTTSGIIITVIIGVWGIIHNNQTRKKSRIALINEDSVGLFGSIVSNFNNIEINYNKSLVDETLIFYRGTFINSGNRDIHKDHISTPLTLSSPDDYICLEYKISNHSNDLKVSAFLNKDSKLTFEWDLFRPNEFFSFEALVKYSPSKKVKSEYAGNSVDFIFKRLINYKQRILDLDKIEYSNFNKFGYLDTFLSAIAALILILIGLFDKSLEHDHLFVKYTNNEYLRVEIYKDLFNNKSIHFFDSAANEIRDEDLEVAENNNNLIRVRRKPWYSIAYQYAALLVGFILLLVSINSYLNNKRKYKLYNIIRGFD